MNGVMWRISSEMDGLLGGLVPFLVVCVVVLVIGVPGLRCPEAAFVKSMLSNCGVSARSSSRKPLSESDAGSPSAERHAVAPAASSPASPRLRTAMSAQRRVTSKIRRSEQSRGARAARAVADCSTHAVPG